MMSVRKQWTPDDTLTLGAMILMVLVTGLFLAFLLLLSADPAAAQQKTYSGTIDARGYTPPAGVTVQWTRPKFPTVVKRLNPAVRWDGSTTSESYLCRYAECDRSVLGMQIASQGVETRGSMSYLIMAELFGAAGVPLAKIDDQGVTDFGIVHGVNRQLSCSDFVKYVGRPDPFCKEDLSGKKLRPEPENPVGCCKTFLPCVVSDGREPGTKWREQVATPQGGVKSCWMIQPAKPPGDDIPPVDPVDPIDPIDPPPVGKARCWLLKMSTDGIVTIVEVVCP